MRTRRLAILRIPASGIAAKHINEERGDLAAVCDRQGGDDEDEGGGDNPIPTPVFRRRRVRNGTYIKQG